MSVPTLRTERLVLRQAVWADLDAVHRLMSDPRVMRYWSRPEHETLEETRAWLGFLVDQAPDSRDWLIEKDGAVIGKAGAWVLPEVGFLLHPDHWGQGLAQEAMVAVIAALEAEFPALPALTAEVDPRNAASLRLLGRLGFRETHRAERTLLWRDEWCDSIYLARART
ncbi:MAG: GNAT family N-acetyltransferase [Tabrizicola sp.]|uniref:GNAT family N-acetyltransferase n=1 Tax=Tabrizicola sp. TaxID=2005166 RepID=UPI002AB8C14B|nr:GNAT family N-acetyltransferase [Tabrizicola sp.]MDZ4086803.1 GNAT family N-acetyltransferase [Tabrizicola sp.]